MRYQHQGYQLPVDCPATQLTDEDKPDLKKAFDETHQRVYGASAQEEDAEVVTFRLIAEISVPRLELPEIANGGDPTPAQIAIRPLFDLNSASFLDAAIYDRAKLCAGDKFDGPAVVQQFDSTTVVLAGMSCAVDLWGNLIIETGAGV